jgi:uncharacterized membrane protein
MTSPDPTPSGEHTSFPRRLLSFIRSTLIGGVFVIAPIGVLLFVVGKVAEVVYTALTPVMGVLPFDSTAGLVLAALLAVAIVVTVCFFAGLLARTTLTRNLVRSVESVLLSNLPGYALMKGVGSNLLGADTGDLRPVVAVRFEATTMIGFQMDRLGDDRLVVYVPNVPNAFAGTLHIVAADRVTPIGLTMRTALDTLGRLGIGSAAVLDGVAGCGEPPRER